MQVELAKAVPAYVCRLGLAAFWQAWLAGLACVCPTGGTEHRETDTLSGIHLGFE